MLRLIARLDVKGANLVKGVHLEGLRVLGAPTRFAGHYYRAGADEIFYQDVVASLYGRNNLLEVVEQTSREVFIPMTVGGGLRSLEDIRAVLRAGADKVAINTAALARPELIREAAQRFGSSTIVVSIEAKKMSDGRTLAFTDNGREPTGVEVLPWAQQAVELGAGEILLTSVDQEGTGTGFDLELVRTVSRAVPVPVIASGGAGSREHVQEVAQEGEADAVALASVLHYQVLAEHPEEFELEEEGNVHFLSTRGRVSHISGHSLPELKAHLLAAGLPCRPPREEAS